MPSNLVGSDLGAVSAYAYAVEHGYMGAEEEFALEQANFAKNAQQVRLDKEATEKLATQVNNVNVESEQTMTGVIIRTTDRTGVTTETKLDSLVQINTWKDIESIVTAGVAKKYLRIGNAYNAKYRDPNTQKEYEIPWNIVDIRNVTTPTGETKEAVIIQLGRVLPEEVMFDAWEAFYVAKDGLVPGTYHVVIVDEWGGHHKPGDTWSFTLTRPVPKGGLLAGFHDTPYSGFGSAKVESFNSLTDTTPIESVVPRKATEGKKLGDFTFAGNAQLNSIQRCCYGYNNYKQSYQRQYLNNSGKGWWVSQNEYDLPPVDYKNRFGFMTGWDAEFLSVLKPFKSIIGRNNVTDGGGTDEVNDIFVLPSLEEMNIKKQVSTEGPALPYWKEASPDGLEFPWSVATPELVHLDVNGTACYVRFRSASVYHANNAWNAYPSGNVHDHYARHAFSGAPLAAIY